MTWEWNVPLAFNVFGSVAIAAFGVLVAFVRPRTVQATVVASFSIAYGVATGLVNLALAAGTTTVDARVLAWGAGVAMLVATVPLAVMWWVLPGPGRPRGAPLVIALLVGSTTAALLSIPVLFGEALGSPVVGLPHFLLYTGVVCIQAGTWWGLILLLASRLPDGSSALRGQTALLAGALALYPASNTQYVFGDDGWFALVSWITLVVAPVAAAAWLWAGHRAGPSRAGRNVAWTVLGAALVGVVMGTFGGDIGTRGGGLSGVARLATVAILSYAVVRHHALGIDAKLRFGISKSTVAAVFIAVFFIASEVAQQFFGETLESNYLGILAAGALVFAIAPLSRMTDRLAEKALPPMVAADPAVDLQREELYRSAVRLALRDRRLSREEESALFRLAGGLGLRPERAHQILAETEGQEGTAD